jgi:hypothetical protein
LAHTLTVGKSRASDVLPVGQVVAEPGADLADVLLEWVGRGVEPSVEPEAPQAPAAAPPPRAEATPPAEASEAEDAAEDVPFGAPKAWSDETTRRQDDLVAQLAEMGTPSGGWPAALDKRSREWFGKPLGETTDEEGRVVNERLEGTLRQMRERTTTGGGS